MMDKKVLTVANVNTYIKQLMDRDYVLKNLMVQGEVSNYKAHSSGHLYFTLKDDNSAISCVMFRSYVQDLDRPLQNGMKIIVSGSVSVYERSGQYQIYAKKIQEDGLGKLYIAFEKLKMKLEGEGLFEPALKQPIPKYVKKVGIVTSQTGAAIKDMVQVSARRNPYVQLVLYPSLVQGNLASHNIVQGIEWFNRQKEKVDVLIVGRGGGSIEDLWPFNEENVARAIVASMIPVISAVGHETDFTIADFVADMRAPTPSAAAELAVYDYHETMRRIGLYQDRLKQWLEHQVVMNKGLLERLMIRLEHQNPKEKFEQKYQYIAELEDRLLLHMNLRLKDSRQKTDLLRSRLEGQSPFGRLKKGFAYISDEADRRIDSVDKLDIGALFNMTLSDGVVTGQVLEVEKEV